MSEFIHDQGSPPWSVVALLLLISALVTNGFSSELRTWKSRSGKHSIIAEFDGLEGDMVALHVPNRRLIRVRLENLSDHDKEHVFRAHSDNLIDSAVRIVGVERQLAEKKLREASKTDPTCTKADFMLGLLYALVDRDYRTAELHFKTCADRWDKKAAELNRVENANLVAAVNNVALCQARLHKHSHALKSWTTATNLASDDDKLNISTNLDVYLHATIRQPRQHIRKKVAELYATVPFAKDSWRWQYMTPSSDRKDQLKKDPPRIEFDEPRMPLGSGSGFVVQPGRVLTNLHVIRGATRFTVADNSKPPRVFSDCTVIDHSAAHDLALLQVRDLDLPPLPLGVMAPVGSEVGILGYPRSDVFGKSLMFTQAAISGRANVPGLGDALVTEAAANPGNSGGPMFNERGDVVGVCTAIVLTEVKYTAGIPSDYAVAMIRRNTPTFEPKESEASSDPPGWPALVDRLSKSTVHIVVYGRRTFAPQAHHVEQEILGNTIADPWCLACDGRLIVDCPVNDCARGGVRAYRDHIVSGAGQYVIKRTPIRVTCRRCGGDGVVRCRFCSMSHAEARSIRAKLVADIADMFSDTER